jgi:hypothetical protein
VAYRYVKPAIRRLFYCQIDGQIDGQIDSQIDGLTGARFAELLGKGLLSVGHV